MKNFEIETIKQLTSKFIVAYFRPNEDCPSCPLREFCKSKAADLDDCYRMWETYFESDEMAWEGILRITKPYKRKDTNEQ